jgi:signal transduction histidine kinase
VRAIDGLNQTIRDIRNYILDLRPQRFQGRDLQQGLAELARELRAHSFLNVNVEVESEASVKLSPEQTVEILHITREALTNVRKHARANQVEINVNDRSGVLLLTIADNGIGLDPDLIRNGSGNGMHNMRERAQALGGKISFNRVESGGTQIQLSVPVIQ